MISAVPMRRDFSRPGSCSCPCPSLRERAVRRPWNDSSFPTRRSCGRGPGKGSRSAVERWVWQEHRSPQAVVDFNAVAGRVADRSVVYAACYIESDRAHDGLWLQVGSDDQSKVYLNGREIYQYRQTRKYRGMYRGWTRSVR